MTTPTCTNAREDARGNFRVRTYEDLSERNRAMIDMIRASLSATTHRNVTTREVMGVIADVSGDMAGLSHLTIDQEAK